jgi:hypothetical protein
LVALAGIALSLTVCKSASAASFAFSGLAGSGSRVYDQVNNIYIDLSGISFSGVASYNPNASLTTNEGVAGYYNQIPPVQFSLTANNNNYQTIGRNNGYSYVYVRNFPLGNYHDRFLLEVLGYNANNTQSVYSAIDFLDTNGDAISSITPTLPPLDFSKYEQVNFSYNLRDTIANRDLFTIVSTNVTASPASVDEPSMVSGLGGDLAVSGTVLTLKRKKRLAVKK